ncbi:MAG: polysaccharide deacetylase family protein [Butyricicoccus sp.]|nr:polysaccharide deacetylase family protein [Butyricicoccus sp.]
MKIIGVLLIVAVCAVAAIQTKRLWDADAALAKLQGQTTDAQAASGSGQATGGKTGSKALKYQTLYPEMKVDNTGAFEEGNAKAVYLTFDDGPSSNTEEILDALAERDQKATFFVVGKNIEGREDTLKRIVDEGHTLGIHGYSHEYNKIYSSVEAFLEDFHEAYQAVYDACGVYPTVFRFPGGSVNAYNRDVYQAIIAEMIRRGFVYYDWNVSGGDATGDDLSASEICENVVDGVSDTEHPIVLLHDASNKDATAEAVGDIVDQLLDVGRYCDKLTPNIQPVTFSYSE